MQNQPKPGDRLAQKGTVSRSIGHNANRRSLTTRPGIKHRPNVARNGYAEQSNPFDALQQWSRQPAASTNGKDCPRSQRPRESQGIRRRGHGKQEGKGTGRGHVLWQTSKIVLKTGKHSPGKSSSGTFFASKSASTKLKSVATKSVFAGYNGYCFILSQHDAWQYGRYHKTIRGKTPLAWMGLPVSRHFSGCGW